MVTSHRVLQCSKSIQNWPQVLLLLLLVFGWHASSVAEELTVFSGEVRVTAQQLIESARGNDLAYKLVKSLTTEVGPRLAGSAQEARAREWAVRTMREMGLANVRIEEFTTPYWQRGVERGSIVSPFPQALTLTALGGSGSTPQKGVMAEVVAFASLAALTEAQREQVTGKIVFIDEVMSRTRDGKGYGVAVRKRVTAASTAQALGAVGLLIRSVGTSAHRFAHTGMMGGPDAEQPPLPAAALSAPDADQLQRVLGYGQPVTVHMLLTPKHLPPALSGNVVGEIVGGENSDEIVVLAAHLDSWDLGTGAVDDGAGVGIVLAAAKLLLEKLPSPPARTLRVVLFGAEETGYAGAKAYVEKHAATLSQQVVAAESDFGTGDIWRFDSYVEPRFLATLNDIGLVLAPLNIARGNNEARGGPDIRFLRDAGVPVVTLLQDGSDYFDVHHTADDTLAAIAPRALDQNVAAYAIFAYLATQSGALFRE